ncbi:hypothetical protein SBA3_1960032 [Candidatus Sulfopaludibacter sp. SbA3]|nr:hypothetical protein SBA3_1960032 [Candidatus Sulfopaludibacter sp. SbA3]
MAGRLALDQAPGTDFGGQLALWQVIAGLLIRGSRFSTVRRSELSGHPLVALLGMLQHSQRWWFSATNRSQENRAID